jgi:hypothetical protein
LKVSVCGKESGGRSYPGGVEKHPHSHKAKEHQAARWRHHPIIAGTFVADRATNRAGSLVHQAGPVRGA